MNDEKIKVVLVEPGKLARVAEIGTELEDLQKTVQGLIEAYYPFEEEVCIVCNEESKYNGMKLNRAVYDPDSKEMMDIIAGPFFICDCSGEEFASLSEEQQKRYVEQFKYPEHFVRFGNAIEAVKYEPKAVNEREER